MSKSIDLEQHILKIPDFPKPGILFYDISTLIGCAEAWAETIRRLKTIIQAYNPDIVAGVESRGFLVAAPLSIQLNIGMQMIRKKGKLPGAIVSHTYDLEYGQDTLEVQHNEEITGKRVVVVDDILATGGTLAAASSLMSSLGAHMVGSACIIELSFLKGQMRLAAPFHSLVKIE